MGHFQEVMTESCHFPTNFKFLHSPFALVSALSSLTPYVLFMNSQWAHYLTSVKHTFEKKTKNGGDGKCLENVWTIWPLHKRGPFLFSCPTPWSAFPLYFFFLPLLLFFSPFVHFRSNTPKCIVWRYYKSANIQKGSKKSVYSCDLQLRSSQQACLIMHPIVNHTLSDN